MKGGRYFILSLNPGYDQWHIVRSRPAVQNVFRADEVLHIISGKGLNVARALKNLACKEYVCMNILGGKTGEIIRDLGRKEHLNCLEYRIAGESRINTCVMLEYDKKTLSYNDPGPVLSREEVSGLKILLKGIMDSEEKQSFVISGAPCRGISEQDFREILEYGVYKGHRFAVDVSGNWLKAAGDYPLSLMKVNREEFQEAFQLDAFLFTKKLKRFKFERGIEELIVTDGENGSIACGKNGECLFGKAEKVQGGNYSVGSGDSFLAGYLAKYAQDASLEECLKYAGACGLANTYKIGPAMITKEEVNRLEKYITIGKKGESVV
ncbi:PfkB family carbohydrate kinase [Muricomes sp. OA1]|uniref:Tagatose-6-phosphate kinase n=2 Tax=Lachnospiraceae TaxID=186803 RepID=A0A3E2WY35_9FIRM|nr:MULTISPECIES: PfkB family carbohydrate kinase [Clostridia]MCH1974552.1 PfkB family carbohydrate kinase [Muricomes sp. OA1]MSC84524.1 hypothetical protein [Eubacterium sp. BIOML-A1]MSD06928.1 hypothetical protein [Eubacterium sp. BIOML-A2]RGC32986.1 hypothetical protein DWX41_07920 [Hungatella hathewayi]RYT17424.1 hypothetical protein EAI89_12205 [Eubacterium sp. am_0171]